MDIPEKVSLMVVDAWKVTPPCTLRNPYCHVQCPYYRQCYPDETEDEDDELLLEYYEEMKSRQQD